MGALKSHLVMSDSSEGSISSSFGILSFSKSGNGPNVLLAFHGFGQSKKDLYPFIEPFLGDHTVYCFDVFFHGNSHWDLNSSPTVSPLLWLNFVKAFLAQEQVESFSLAGFSLGSRFALQVLEAFPKQVQGLYLLAPDNIKPDFWYELATGTQLGAAILKNLVNKPAGLFRLVHFLTFIQVVAPSVKKFVASQMNTKPKRLQVYHCWTAFRPLLTKPYRIAQLLNNHKIPLIIFCGKMDKVVPKATVMPLLSKTKKSTLIELETGHNGILKQAGKYLSAQKLAPAEASNPKSL